MKLLAQLSQKLGLLGGLVMGTLLTSGLPAFALPEEAVVETLSSVPVFTLTDETGAPLVASVETNDGQTSNSVAGVFIDREDAQDFLKKVQQEKADLANQIEISPTTLGQIYALSQDPANANLAFELVPDETEVASAKSVLKEKIQVLKAAAKDNPGISLDNQGNPVDSQGRQIIPTDASGEPLFSGVPLFFVSAGDAGQYLTIRQGDRQMVPFYFQKGDVEGLLRRLKAEQPSTVANTSIQVINLSRIIATLQESEEAANLDDSLVLVPPRESVEYIRSLQQPRQPN